MHSFLNGLKSLPYRRWPRRPHVPMGGLIRLFGAVARLARLVLLLTRERKGKTMNTILLIVLLVLLFGGGGWYWNSRRG